MPISYRLFSQISKPLLFSMLFLQQMHANEVQIDQSPVAMVYNPGPNYSLINSVDFHPSQNLFCVTYTHNDLVILYKIQGTQPEMVQILNNPLANLHQPQHAAFSPDGKKIVVANWENQTLTVYQRKSDGLFQNKPTAVIPPPSCLKDHKPHGIAFSPCGNYLAIAYGAASYHGKAVALFSVIKDGLDFELLHFLGSEELPGIPKGITFSPDGTCFLVTFSDANCLVIFNLSENNKPTPRQVIQGKKSRISRPEDVKISPHGDYCAISNSDQNRVTFYSFDKTSNRITGSIPIATLKNPKAGFHFPHGMAFSPDGTYLVVTEFGLINTTDDGDVVWNLRTSPKQSKFSLYKLSK